MNKLQQVIIAVNNFSLGILLPVFNLVLMEKGATLQTLPLLVGIYSATVLCLELPSGVCADIYGRKIIFLMSTVFMFVSFSLLIMADSIVWLVLAMIFFGMGRAFSSGSLDALFIDQTLVLHGESCLAGVTTRMAILESVGLAVGAIAGGIIANATGTYLANIVLRLVLTAILFILCLFFVKEQPLHSKSHHTTLMEHIRQGKQVLTSAHELGFVFIGIFFLGFLLFTIETYWQPAFMQMPNTQNTTWMLGFITFIGFFSVAFGNTIVKKILDKHINKWWNVYNICRIIFAGCIVIFAFQKNSVSFVICYACIYLTLGASNVAESALINKFTPNHMRASMLSLNSLMMQIGSLCASLFSSIMILKLQFAGLWIVAGVFLGGYAIIATAIINKYNQKNRNNTAVIP